MPWLLLMLASIILWGATDILNKKSLNYTDSLSEYKTFVWIGLVMGFAGVIMAIFSDSLLDSIMMLKDNLYLIPLCVFYAIDQLSWNNFSIKAFIYVIFTFLPIPYLAF